MSQLIQSWRPLLATAALVLPLNVAAQTPLPVLATVGMLAEVTEQIAGECAQVTALMGAGSDPHRYQPTASDVNKLRDAELILYVDHALEAQLASVLNRFSERTSTVGVAAATFEAHELLEDAEEPGEIDPHIWMDASMWAQVAETIAAQISDLRPDCAADIAEYTTTYTAQLHALHEWITASIASVPAGQRALVTAHDAFYYYGTAYGLEASEAIEGISTESEASIADIRAIADFVVANAVPAVFVETTINPRTIQAMVAEVQSRGHDVVIGGELYSDAMGEPGTVAGTYIGMLWENTVTITEALGGTVAPLPEVLSDWAADWNI